MLKKAVLLSFVICLLSIIPSNGVLGRSIPPEEQVTLASLGREQCIAVLEDLGVTIPQELDGADILKMVSLFESDPDMVITVNYSVGGDFLEAVQQAVKRYHGLQDVDQDSITGDQRFDERGAVREEQLDEWYDRARQE